MLDSRKIEDLHPTLQHGAKELIKRLLNKGYKCSISSTYRDIEYQNMLYAKGRTTAGNIVTNAKGGNSIHNYKLAFDVFQNIKGQEYDKNFLNLAGKIWTDMGGEWGGSWKSFTDTPHMQFTNGLTLVDLQLGKTIPSNTKMKWENENKMNIDDAFKILAQKGYINTIDYWLKIANSSENYNKEYVNQLIINIASKQ